MKVAPTQLISWVEGGENIQKNEVLDERGTSACTLLNSTLPNLTLLDEKNEDIAEEKNEELPVTESPTHKDFSFDHLEQAIQEKNELYEYLVDRFSAQRPDIGKAGTRKELQKFCDFYGAKSFNGKKRHWEKQKTFCVPLRLRTWFSGVRITQEYKEELEREKSQRILEYNKKLFDDQNNNA
jgi:hypothetical protein